MTRWVVESLLAERQQAIDDVAGYRSELQRRVERCNALLAERQQALDERDAAHNTCGTCGDWSGRGERGCEECAEFRQESGWAQEVEAARESGLQDTVSYDLVALRARCEHAIDALRRISSEHPELTFYIDGVLSGLGEQP